MAEEAGVESAPPRRALRFERLCSAVDLAVDETLRACDFPTFLEAFGDLSAPNRDALFDAYTQVAQTLRRNTKEEFMSISTENDVDGKLQRLEQLLDDQQELADGTRRVPASTSAPEESVRAEVVAVKIAERDRLRSVLQKLEQDNQDLHEGLLQRRSDVFQASQTVQAVATPLREAVQRVETWEGVLSEGS